MPVSAACPTPQLLEQRIARFRRRTVGWDRSIRQKPHEELREWVGGPGDPEEFDPAKATTAMRKELPDWRGMSGW